MEIEEEPKKNYIFNYMYSVELSELRSKLISIKKEVGELKHKEQLQFFNQKLHRLQEVYNTVIKFLENMVKKKTQAIKNMGQLSTSDTKPIPVSWTYYDDIISLVADVKKLKSILEDPNVFTDDTADELKDFLEQLRKAVYVLNMRVLECEDIFESSKKLVTNLSILKADIENEEKSDLGCYPHEESAEDNDYCFADLRDMSVESTTDNEFAHECEETVKATKK